MSIIETLISLLIGTLVITASSAIYILTQKAWEHGSIQAETAQNARVILDRLAREVRQANEIVNLDENPSNEMMFEDGHTQRLQYIRYYIDSNNLNRQQIIYYFAEDPGTLVRYDALDQNSQPPIKEIEQDQVISENIDNAQFSYDNVVQIQLNINSTNFNTDIYPRNIK